MQSEMELKKIRHIAKIKKRKKKILENLQRYATSHAEHTVKAPKSCRRLLVSACIVPASFGPPLKGFPRFYILHTNCYFSLLEENSPLKPPPCAW